jgi:hypothetical protein
MGGKNALGSNKSCGPQKKENVAVENGKTRHGKEGLPQLSRGFNLADQNSSLKDNSEATQQSWSAL